MKTAGSLAGAALGLAAALAFAARRRRRARRSTIYTSLENDQLGPFKQAIEAAVPEVEVVWVRDSTGVITARFLAEKDNPRADMVLGHAATALLLFEKMGLLETYKPAGRRRAQAGVPRHQGAVHLDRHGRLSRRHLLQHRRGRQGRREGADLLEGPAQPRTTRASW